MIYMGCLKTAALAALLGGGGVAMSLKRLLRRGLGHGRGCLVHLPRLGVPVGHEVVVPHIVVPADVALRQAGAHRHGPQDGGVCGGEGQAVQ